MTNKGFEVFQIAPEQVNYNLDATKKVLKEKLKPEWIKKRKQGSTELSYIGGNTVIHLLNAAFNYQWSFEIVLDEVVQSVPKPAYTGWGQNKKPVLNEDGTHKMEAQPPYLKVLGRLTVPGLGVREQFGSKIFIGGATEQESAFKSASTDALKKCASLFGIGLELYGDEEYDFEDTSAHPAVPQEQVKEVAKPVETTPAPAKQETKSAPTPAPAQQQKPASQPAQAQTASQGAADPNAWHPEDINRLKELKAILGITDNSQLDPYVREFLDNGNMTYLNITPQNVKAFNIFLAKKAESE